jgi:hypothetical protein
LDFDGSGEVNVDELQDPLLSTGILKTRHVAFCHMISTITSQCNAIHREQVIRVVSNSDKNGTMGKYAETKYLIS